MTKLFTTLANVFLFFSAILFVGATPIHHEAREILDVFTPPVLYPHAGTVWYVNQTHNVTWSIADAPVNITNKIGMIMLRSGLITTPLIMADGFSILLGRIEVKVPWVTPGNDYSLVLFGDSGNFSPQFSIQDAP